MQVLPINLKSNSMALQNAIFLPITLAKDPNMVIHIKVSGKLIKGKFTSTIQKPNIAVSKILREFLKIDLVHSILIEPTEPLKQKDYGISRITLKVSVRKHEDKIENISQDRMIAHLREKETNVVFNLGQPFYLKVDEVIFQLQAKQITVGKKAAEYGLLVRNSQINLDFEFEVDDKVSNASTSSGDSIFKPGFKATDMGIGGLDQELFNIFRRTFASRRFSNDVVQKFGVKHVKGILLYGPPGTGKTLIARQLASALNIKKENLKIVNGPQIFSKYVGQSQENIRKLFASAREDENKYGPKSPLHIIVFDEIDAICKQRGVYSSGTNVNDQVVNQLLSNIDGVESLNNIIVIGMTNRKDLLDEAILRPGRFQVHIQVSLPDLDGRKQIFKIHTQKLAKNNLLDKECQIQKLAMSARNFTGAQIQALVKCASSHTITRTTNVMKFNEKFKIQKDLKVQMKDFLSAFEEIKPQFGVDDDKFTAYLNKEKVINYGQNFDRITNSLEQLSVFSDDLAGRVKSVLLYGHHGSGKTQFAVQFARHCSYPYIKFITPQLLVGKDSNSKIHFINKIFEDAYKTSKACIIIDDIERIIEYTRIGKRFSNPTLQTLLTLINKIPPNLSTNLFIIGTTSMPNEMNLLDIANCFHQTIKTMYLEQVEIETILQKKLDLNEKLASQIANELAKKKTKNQDNPISIKNLFNLIGMVQEKQNVKQWMQNYQMLSAQ